MANCTSSSNLHLLQVNRSIVSAIKSFATENISGFSIKYKSPQHVHYIKAEEEAFFGVLQGVLEYAGKLAGKAGKISIEHSTLKGRRHNDRSDLVKFCVRVMGRGISEEMFTMVNAELQRMNTALSENKNGSSTKKFDIAFSKTYFREVGGNVWIESNLNKGLSIYFTYPLLRAVNLHNMKKPDIKVIRSSFSASQLQQF